MPLVETYTLPSPLGDLILGTWEGRLVACSYDDGWRATRHLLERHAPEAPIEWRAGPRPAAADDLVAFFAGDRGALDRIPVVLWGTPFQQAVWRRIHEIPYGATCTYRDVAISVDRPRATRAVGAATGQNPVAVVVPCHRVLGKGGALTGYGGGLDRKTFLLELEGALSEVG